MRFITAIVAQVPAIPAPPDGSGLVGWLLAAFGAIIAGILGAVWILLREQRQDFMAAQAQERKEFVDKLNAQEQGFTRTLEKMTALHSEEINQTIVQMKEWRIEAVLEAKAMRETMQLFLNTMREMQGSTSDNSRSRKTAGGS